MLLNYIILALRAIRKNGIFSAINILGLVIGISSVLLISLYMIEETSYDRFFKDSERIYRVALKRVYPERVRYFSSSASIMAEVIRDNYPEVEEAGRMHRMYFVSEVPVEVGEDTFMEPRFYFADGHFFRVFSHEFIFGDPATALADPGSVVITESTAIKYFGSTEVLHETINMFDSTALSVTGVIKDPPGNTHIHFDLMGSIHQIGYIEQSIETNNWINPWLYTYIKLRKGADPDLFEAGLDSLVYRFGNASIAQALGENYVEEGHKFEYFLQPVTDIHLHSDLDTEVETNGDFTNVILLSAIATVILIISCINFINLSTAKSSERAREVGIRKVMGSLRSHLTIQFLVESLVLVILSSLLSIGSVNLALPFFNKLLNKSLDLDVLFSPELILVTAGLILLVGVLAGIYPALSISSHDPAVVLKGSFKGSGKGKWLRNSMMIFQFFISIVMITVTIAIKNQMEFLKKKDLGFAKENVMVIQNAGDLGENYHVFRDQLLEIQGVENAGAGFAMPGDFLGSNVLRSVDHPDRSDFRANTLTIDDDYFQTMKFQLKEGRTFSREFEDSLSVILNEEAARELALEEPIGARLVSAAGTPDGTASVFTVIGIVKDYNFTSLHHTVTPLVIYNISSQGMLPVMAVRLRDNSLKSAVETKWAELTDEEISYSFLDENLARQYDEDKTAGRMFDIFTYLAIFISCIGLFGLATYIVQQRLAEMSIRKIMGAGYLDISVLFIRDFLKLVLAALLLAMPISWYGIDQWLNGFAYHIAIGADIFIYAWLITASIIGITLIYQIYRMITVDPVNTLRD